MSGLTSEFTLSYSKIIMTIELNNVQPIPLKETPGGISPVSQTFGTRCVFEKGKNYLISAPSGKGKSTLLHIIYGIRDDYDGQASITGRNIRQFSPEDWATFRQKHLSIVFQDLRLFPRLTAMENTLLKASQTNTVTEGEIRDWAKRLGVSENLEQTAATLSYGQRQRIAIIRALCQPFDFLLLDEPFSHLDDDNTRLAASLIREVSERQNASLVHVSIGEESSFRYDAVWAL
jgi:ABC-type lipoprotein export system ATPase subunit